MRLKTRQDLKNINPRTSQSQQLHSAFEAYELERSQQKKPQGKISKSTNPAKSPAAKELAKITEPQQILLRYIMSDSVLSTLDWKENYSGAVPGRKYEIDIAITSLKIGCETDGWGFHGKHKESFLRDRDKDFHLSINGWMVLRVQAGLILSSPEEALNRVKKFCSVWVPRQNLLLSELPLTQ